LSAFQWISLVGILFVAFAGGYMPLFHPEKVKSEEGFPSGEAFAAGVFLALSLTIMLPSGTVLFKKLFPGLDYPLASLVAIISFLFLLSLEHLTIHLSEDSAHESGSSSPVIPLIMTVMIAVPSFFLGAALGVSSWSAELFIFIAIVAHKGSAGFALALKMTKSSLTRKQTFIVFSLFALSTPFGILIGADVRQIFSGMAIIAVKAFIISMAAGVFLYMSTLHELRRTPLITTCCTKKGFLLLLAGFILTAFVRFLLGEAHHM
jgi:zinc transporter ZupT